MQRLYGFFLSSFCIILSTCLTLLCKVARLLLAVLRCGNSLLRLTFAAFTLLPPFPVTQLVLRWREQLRGQGKCMPWAFKPPGPFRPPLVHRSVHWCELEIVALCLGGHSPGSVHGAWALSLCHPLLWAQGMWASSVPTSPPASSPGADSSPFCTFCLVILRAKRGWQGRGRGAGLQRVKSQLIVGAGTLLHCSSLAVAAQVLWPTPCLLLHVFIEPGLSYKNLNLQTCS